MSSVFETQQIDVSGVRLTLQPSNWSDEISTLESRVQTLEEENARLQEALQFFLEICCSDE